MRGQAGMSFLTKNMQKALSEANLIKGQTELNSQHRTKDNLSGQKKKLEPKRVPHGRKPSRGYDAMGMMLERIRSVSIANPEPTHDDVFIQPHGRDAGPSSTQNKGVPQPSRKSVIIRMIKTIPMEDSNLQKHYNVPVHNSFSQLLN